jgi:hypothetical protein
MIADAGLGALGIQSLIGELQVNGALAQVHEQVWVVSGGRSRGEEVESQYF